MFKKDCLFWSWAFVGYKAGGILNNFKSAATIVAHCGNSKSEVGEYFHLSANPRSSSVMTHGLVTVPTTVSD